MAPAEAIPLELIERKIHVIRKQKVVLDRDLAELYQVPTKALNQAVRRNLARFPPDFMFQLDDEEFENLRSQTVTSTATVDAGTFHTPSPSTAWQCSPRSSPARELSS